jgi:broad specificity phosphatase PhoE
MNGRGTYRVALPVAFRSSWPSSSTAGGYPIARIVSSPSVRCLQTVEPADALAVDADPAALAALLLNPVAHEAVLCSHGELIGAVLIRLVRPDLADAGQLTWPKGSAWVLEVDAGQVRQAHYLPPLRLRDAKAPSESDLSPHNRLI